MKYKKIGIISDSTTTAKKIYKTLINRCECIDILHSDEKVDVIVVIGGDGKMLHSMHEYMHLNVPFYGLKTGTLGFLMNNFTQAPDLNYKMFCNTLDNARKISICPLKMEAFDVHDNKFEALAINEVYVIRQTHQAAKIEISVNSKVKLKTLVSDGAIVATPAGSTAYNSSAGGPILPIGSNLLAITPISPFRPRRWHGALLHYDSQIQFKSIDCKKRPLNAVADFFEVRNVKSISVSALHSKEIKILFDKDQSFEDKIANEQFLADHQV